MIKAQGPGHLYTIRNPDGTHIAMFNKKDIFDQLRQIYPDSTVTSEKVGNMILYFDQGNLQ